MLRRQGKSRREITEILGPMSSSTLTNLLQGEPLPPERAGPGYAESRKRVSEGVRRYWDAERASREAARAAITAAAAAGIETLTDREILIAGAVAYWCEGARNKPHRRADRVTFANGDPKLISFFLLFLDTVGIPRPELAFQLQIHETADVPSAEQFWLEQTGARPEQFCKTFLKQHNPATTRKNVSDDYHGCLRVDVRRSCELYRRIEGWASAVTRTAEASDKPGA